MKVTFLTHPKGIASMHDGGWEEGETYAGSEVAVPHKDDIVLLKQASRYVVREVQWSYTSAGGRPVAEAAVYLWRSP